MIPPQTSPCPFLPTARWATLRQSALDFIDRFGEQAYDLGWTAPELFGVDPQRGTLRGNRCGALMVDGRPAYSLELNRIRFDNSSASRDRFDQRPGVPVWEYFAKRGLESRGLESRV